METRNKRVELGCDTSRKPSRLVFLLLWSLFICIGAAFSQTILTPSDESRLSDRILHGSTETKRTALAEIRNLRSPEASRLALAALRDSDPIVRATAAASVVFLHTNESASALVTLLSDKDDFVRREAAYALGDLRDESATTALLRSMQNDKVLEVRTAAAIALGKIGSGASVPSFIAILKTRPREDDEFLRRSAARSIGQIAQIATTGDPTVLTPQNFLPEKFKDLDSPNNSVPGRFSAAVDVLTSVLRNSNESDDTRREAAFALGAIGDSRSIPILQKYAVGPDPYLAEICKEALLKIERRNKTAGPTE